MAVACHVSLARLWGHGAYLNFFCKKDTVNFCLYARQDAVAFVIPLQARSNQRNTIQLTQGGHGPFWELKGSVLEALRAIVCHQCNL